MDEIPSNPADVSLEIGCAGVRNQFPLVAGGVYRIGRSAENAIHLADESVSRSHLLLQVLNEHTALIVDLGSRNGTFVNGQRLVTAAYLRDGDRIMIGKLEGVLHSRQEGGQREQSSTLASTNLSFAQKFITVLVIDICDFTALTQKLDNKLMDVTGAFFRDAGKVLRVAGASIQKYIGDAIMAVWLHGDEESRSGPEVLSAVEGLRQVVAIAQGLQRRFTLDCPVRIGSGMNSGWASVGNVGSIAASDFTAMGDVVNEAFRLESATRYAGCDLLVGIRTRDALLRSGGFCSDFAEHSLKLKGYEEPVAAWGTDFAQLSGNGNPVQNARTETCT